MMKLTIRKAEERDIPELKRLLMQVLNIHAEGRPDLFIPNTTKYTDEELRELIHDPDICIFTADAGDQLAGYIFCMLKRRLHNNNMHDITTLFIDDLCVDESMRRSHVGAQLLEYAEEYARSLGCYNITLNVWAFNEHAYRFYEKMGMRPQETVMEKILGGEKK